MQINHYSLELTAVFRTYAASLGPTPRPEYKVLHDWHPWIKVPRGYLPIRIVQFFQDVQSLDDKKPYHWAIFIPTSTSRGVGNFYEIAGSQQGGYFTRQVIHSRHVMWDQYEKGTHLVGYVAPSFLKTLERHFSTVPVEQSPDRNSQTWVVEALKGLEHPQMYAVQMDYSQWREQMEIVEEAWDVGDA